MTESPDASTFRQLNCPELVQGRVMDAPGRCLYCDGTDPNCGFCEMGVPLDTQEDWDRSWGKVFQVARTVIDKK